MVTRNARADGNAVALRVGVWRCVSHESLRPPIVASGLHVPSGTFNGDSLLGHCGCAKAGTTALLRLRQSPVLRLAGGRASLSFPDPRMASASHVVVL